MKKKSVNQTEIGRSMVEMLGVLAIIGVLSVGGIAGYTSAMNKHRANDTVQRLMRRAVIISSQKQLGQTANLSSFNENDGAYAITLSAGAEASDPTFTLQAANVPQDICEKINALSWPSATISTTTCDTTQDMTFTFNNDLSAAQDSGSPALPSEFTECRSDADCTGGRTCGEIYHKVCHCDWEEVWDGTQCIPLSEPECTPGYYKCVYSNSDYGMSVLECDSEGHWIYRGMWYDCTCISETPRPTMEEVVIDCGEV